MVDRTRRVLILVISGVLGSLCVLGTAPAGAAGGDFDRVEVKPARVSLAYPGEWVRMDLSEQSIESLKDALDEDNPELAGDLDPEVAARATKLHAQSLVDGDSVEVIVMPGFLGGRTDLEAQIREALGAVPGFELVAVKAVRVGARKAFRVDTRYELTDVTGVTVPVYSAQVVLPKGTFELVNVAVTVDDEPDDIATADRILRSVRSL